MGDTTTKAPAGAEPLRSEQALVLLDVAASNARAALAWAQDGDADLALRMMDRALEQYRELRDGLDRVPRAPSPSRAWITTPNEAVVFGTNKPLRAGGRPFTDADGGPPVTLCARDMGAVVRHARMGLRGGPVPPWLKRAAAALAMHAPAAYESVANDIGLRRQVAEIVEAYGAEAATARDSAAAADHPAALPSYPYSPRGPEAA